MANPPPDILVLGAGVAGASAALFAAKNGRKVAIVSRESAGGADWCDWLHPRAAALLESAGVNLKRALLGRLSGLSFASADLKRHAKCPGISSQPLVARDALRRAILDAAIAEGAAHHGSRTIATGTAHEDRVVLSTSDRDDFSGRFLIAADGVDAPISRQLRHADAARQAVPFHSAQWRGATRSSASKKTADAHLTVILATDGPQGFGYYLDTPSGGVAGLVERRPPAELSKRLRELLSRLADEQLLRSADASAGTLCVRRVPRGEALDRDSHVAKRTILVGDCGGFVCALSQEGILPAVRSAALAANVVHAALGQRHEQDAIGEFDAAWRSELADVLRLPSTDFQFLMPLVFTNQAIAGRMGRAFLLCENM